jgi:hypothetical protein
LVVYVMNSGKRTDLFTKLQIDANIGVASGKKWKLVLDGGIRWNSTYLMIRRALELKEALNIYANDLRDSTDKDDQETFKEDYITAAEWKALGIIKQ